MDSPDDFFSPAPPVCKELEHPSLPQFVVSCTLMAWVFLSYLPQYARIITRQSIEGLSTLYILLGSLSGVCAIGNILTLPTSDLPRHCCRDPGLSWFACVSGLLGIGQVVFGIACFWVLLILYVYYAREEPTTAHLPTQRTASLSGPTTRTRRHRRGAWGVLLAVCAFACAVLLVSAAVVPARGRRRQAWADLLGVAVAALACVQWVPQAVTTWRLGQLGSLSMASVCISAPYTWLFGINMALRVGRAGWSAWAVYLLVGTMQLVLIAMGLSFKLAGHTAPDEVKQQQRAGSLVRFHFAGWEPSEVDRGRRRTSSVASSHLAPDERRPLLAASWRDGGIGSRPTRSSSWQKGLKRGRAGGGEGVCVGPAGR